MQCFGFIVVFIAPYTLEPEFDLGAELRKMYVYDDGRGMVLEDTKLRCNYGASYDEVCTQL